MNLKNDELLEHLTPDVEAGTIKYRDRRMLVFGADALGLLRKNLIERLGVIEGSIVLWKFGYAMG